MADKQKELLWPGVFIAAGEVAAHLDEKWEGCLARGLICEGIIRAQVRFEIFRERLKSECESPIERLLASEWVRLVPQADAKARILGDRCRDLAEVGPRLGQLLEIYRSGATEEGRLFAIFPQIEIAEFRVDFLAVATTVDLFTAGRWVQAAVECDGHDFHERTKEQAARDRSRDRKLQSLGFPVLRFTGAEIYADVRKCTQSLACFLDVSLDKILAEAGC